MDNFQASFPRAKMFMAPLALLASVSGLLGKIERLYPTFLVWSFLGFYFDKSGDRHLLLYSSLSMLFMFPWTAIAINPTNKVLMDGVAPAKKGEAWVQRMMTTWNRLHGVRSLVSAGACLCLGLYWHNRAIWLGYSSIDNCASMVSSMHTLTRKDGRECLDVIKYCLFCTSQPLMLGHLLNLTTKYDDLISYRTGPHHFFSWYWLGHVKSAARQCFLGWPAPAQVPRTHWGLWAHFQPVISV